MRHAGTPGGRSPFRSGAPMAAVGCSQLPRRLDFGCDDLSVPTDAQPATTASSADRVRS
jgi:hypothetical protein